ncbi:hypothetical protein G9P44_000495 [Scheffersomyces stipitis]|nr:hypothetical protein G9P44_000495 [Scheffersomyces stipitis]
MSYNLSGGALRDVFSIKKHASVNTPIILQVTNIKPVLYKDEVKKYRLLLNDGQYAAQGLVDEPCITYLQNNNFSRYSIIEVKEFSTFPTQKHIFIVKDAVIVSPTSEKGNSNDYISVDTYYAEHPDDDNLQIAQRQAAGATNGAGARSESPIPGSEQNRPQQFQQPQQYQNQPSNRNGFQGKITPIETLSPYQNNWTIKARVSYKGDLRTWTNAKGEGKLISVNFLDESDEIKASAFQDVAISAHKLLEEGKVYYISKAKVQASNKKFNTLSHPYELVMDRDTKIEECFDVDNVPKMHFNFIKLNQIPNLDPNAIIDVLGALKIVNEPYKITAKSTGKEFDRRNVTIVDETGFAIDVGLWNNTATEFSIPEGSIIAFKSCRVQDFNGRSLTLTQTGSMLPNPNTPESYSLKGWYDNQGVNANFNNLKVESSGGETKIGDRKTIAQAQDESLGLRSEKEPDYFTVKASISFIKTDPNFCYPACTNEVQYNNRKSACNKKLVEQHDNSWRCEKCDKNYAQPTYRYILTCSIMDETNQIWVTLFEREALKILGKDANELIALQDDSAAFKDYIQEKCFQEHVFRIRAKQDTYNDQVRVRYQCVALYDIDYNAEAIHLSEQLDSLLV